MQFKIVGIGEVLWDILPTSRHLGGAPANFAYHARALGADARVISRIGNDDLGREILQRLDSLGLPSDCTEIDPAAPTGTVTVTLASDGQPQFHIHEHVAWDALRGESAGQKAVAVADAVCFGSLAQRSEQSRSAIRSLVQSCRPTALRIFDINLRQHYFSQQIVADSLRMANVLKINDTELPQLSALLGISGELRTQIEQLAQRYRLRAVAYTRGSHGSLLYRGGQWSDHSGISTKVVDTVGAGDAFTAAMTLGLLNRWQLDRINEQANQVAAYVCSCAGATPPLPPQLREGFEQR